MRVWTPEELEIIRQHYMGPDKDFPKLVKCLSVTWTREDLERLERSHQMLAWDEYFEREKLLSFKPGGPTEG
jgi:hypothetical protein